MKTKEETVLTTGYAEKVEKALNNRSDEYYVKENRKKHKYLNSVQIGEGAIGERETDTSEVIPIFIGASDQECDRIQEKILVYTLQKNTNRKLKIHFLRASDFQGVNASGWGTPFTCLRYAIPKLMNYEGKAIYMDMDMINFRDIGEFYDIYLHGKPFGMVWDAKQNAGEKGTGNYCDSLMLIDCEKAQHFFDWDEVHNWYQPNAFKWTFMDRIQKYEKNPKNRRQNDAVINIDSRWNCFDGYKTDSEEIDGKQEKYDLDQIFQLHFTALSYQPWHSAYLMSAKATHERPDLTDYWWSLVDEVNRLDF